MQQYKDAQQHVSNLQDELEKQQSNVEKAKEQKQGRATDISHHENKLVNMLVNSLHHFKGIGGIYATYHNPLLALPTMVTGRMLSELLTSPELRDNYINGERFETGSPAPLPRKLKDALNKTMDYYRRGSVGSALSGDNKNG